MPNKISLTEHQFRVTETINGAIRLYNNHSITDEELTELQSLFNFFNHNQVPKPGMWVKIPVIVRET